MKRACIKNTPKRMIKIRANPPERLVARLTFRVGAGSIRCHLNKQF